MTKTKVISNKNVRATLPVSFTLIAYLLLDKFSAAGWVWGVVGTFLFLWWIAAIVSILNSEPVDIFEAK